MGAAMRGPSGCCCPSGARTSGECTRSEGTGLEEGWGRSAGTRGTSSAPTSRAQAPAGAPCSGPGARGADGAGLAFCQLPGALSFLPPTAGLHADPTEGLLCVLLQTMAFLSLLLVLVQSLIQYPRPAGDGLDEATHRRMQERQELLERQMARLLQELEQGPPEQQDQAWGASLSLSLQHWPFWVLAGVLLLLGLWFSHTRRSREASNSSKDQSSCETLGDERGKEQEEERVESKEGGKNIDVTVEAEDSSTGKDREVSLVATNEVEGDDDGKVQESSDSSEQRSSDWTGQEDSSGRGSAVDPSGSAVSEEEKKGTLKESDSDRNKGEEQGGVNVEGNKTEARKEDKQGNVAASEKEGGDGGKEERGSGGIGDRDRPDNGNRPGILLVDRVQWPVEKLERGCSVTAELMESLRRVLVHSVSNSFYPVPQEAIGVGSAFEGWSPREWDGVYRVLVPLCPPPGHAFCLELNSAGQMAARSFRVRVKRVCTCQREQLGQEPLCFLHHSKQELRQKHQRSLLKTLCTGSYLDVEKTCQWFSQVVRSSWLRVPQSASWHSEFQPCSRSCQFRLSDGKERLRVEVLLGVRQGDSDIFVVSQPSEAQRGGCSIFGRGQPTKANVTASTAWPETYAVAEAKFFQHVARQVPCESLHLKCLQVFTCVLRGTGFSSSVWKTVLMHVLTTVPLSQWCRKEFARRLWDVVAYLGRCLQLKCLEHFVRGNERLPAEISLPLAMHKVEPLNLFEHLARDAAAHREATQAYSQLRFRLWVLLSSH
ncbi:uncharacterized protein FYW23_002970 [Sylvia borin]